MIQEESCPKPFEYQPQIDEIMDEFDFDKVQKVMEFLEWKWSGPTDYTPKLTLKDPVVPGRSELKKVARRLLNECAKHKQDKLIATGGFEASSTSGYLKLSFVLEDWEGCW